MASNVLEYQLEILKLEIETVNAAIRQMDEITKNVKQWAIALWTAALGGALTTGDLRQYAGTTAAIPLLFWLVDTWHRRIQRKFIWRSIQISKFLNDGRLEQSFTEAHIVNFDLFDPKSRLSKGKESYEAFVAWHKVMLFRSLSILYGGMIVISFVVGIMSIR
jgi:hypothetical protein